MLRDSYFVEPSDLDRAVFEQLVPSDHYLRRVKSAVDFQFVRELLTDCYSSTMGRPGEDPVLLLKLLFLEFQYGLSDREVIAQAQVNVAFRFFLDLSISSRLPHPSLLTQFRARVGPDRFRALFDRVLGQARAHGLVKDRLRLKDATHVIADVAVPCATRLVAHMRERVLAALEPLAPEAVASARAEAEAIRLRTSDLKDEQRLVARVGHLREVVAEAGAVLAREQARLEAIGAAAGSQDTSRAKALREAVETARKVLSDRDPEASDRLVSLQDPDARRGRHGGWYTGYLVDVLMDADSELITAIDVVPANADEAADTEPLIESEERAQGNDIEAVSIDSVGYRGDVLERLVDAEDGPHVRVYVPPFERNEPKAERFGVDRFELDEQRGVLRCPGGQETSTFSPDPKRNGRVYRYRAAQCRGCPFREACFGVGSRATVRQVFKSGYETQYRRAQEVASSEAYREVRREHHRVEGKLSDLIGNHAGRRVRYRSIGRVRVQYVMAALAANIKRMVNHLLPPFQLEVT
jgi:transposase